MPIYEYKCPKGHHFELFQRMTDDPPESCTQCGAGPLQRVLHPVAVHYKGSGFYSTDYGKGGSRKKDGATKDGSSGSSDGAGGSGSSESSGASSGSGESSSSSSSSSGGESSSSTGDSKKKSADA
jgi:putative FmdB family regulatory protein